MNEIENLFDKIGNCYSLSDPFREFNETCKIIFDYETGNVKEEIYNQLRKFVFKNYKTIEPFSDILKILYAEDFARNTKNNYSAIYMWR